MNHRLGTREEVEVAFRTILKHFGPTTMLRFGNDFPKDQSNIFGKADILTRAHLIAKNLVQFFGLPTGSIVVRFSDQVSAGRVELTNEDFYEVELHTKYKTDPQDIPAVLAHELTHVLLWRSGLWLDNTHLNEVLTDTACILFGAGWLSLAAHRTEITSSQNLETTTTKTLGYLSPNEIIWILVRRDALLSKEGWPTNTSKWDDHITKARIELSGWSSIPPFVPSILIPSKASWLSKFFPKKEQKFKEIPERIYFHDPKDESKIIVQCPICCQKLRMQIEKQGKLRCGICRMNWEVDSRLK